MMWPMVLPMQLTALALAVVVAVATLLAPKLKRQRKPTFQLMLVAAVMAYIPSCAGIKLALDVVRFGTFHYDRFEEVNDRRVEQFLPPAATDITLIKFVQGFQAKFKISQSDLDLYLEQMWDRHGGESIIPRAEYEEAKTQFAQTCYLVDEGPQWPPLKKPIVYYGPITRDGAGFTIWYSAEEGLAYENAGYW